MPTDHMPPVRQGQLGRLRDARRAGARRRAPLRALPRPSPRRRRRQGFLGPSPRAVGPVRRGPQVVGDALVAPWVLLAARQIRAAVDLPMILLGGITDRPSMDLAMAEGFELVAMGRALLREPDLVERIAADARTPSLCIHCNKCMPTNFTCTRCVLVDRTTTRGPAWGTPEAYVR